MIRIHLLGRFEIVRGETILRASDWPRRKAAALLQRLALNRRLLKDEAIEFLWPESDPAFGANNLYRTLHALRQTLDARLGDGTAKFTLAFEDGVFTLNEPVWVDADEFQRTAQSALGAPSPRIDSLQSALALYHGDLLPDEVYADWTSEPREALRRLHHDASLSLAALHIEARQYADAIPLLTALVARDACDEQAQRELMRACALAGRRHEALRQYQTCVQALADELGVPPEPQTTALYQHILSGELAPPASAPTREPLRFETGPDSSLVGRESEFESLRFWLREAWRGQGRTILLTGDTGVGKTRLALEALCAATGAGFAPLFGAAYEQEGQLAYQPFIEAFNRYLVAQQRPLSENPITHFKPLGSTDPQQEHWALFNAAANFLRDLAAHSPVVLLLDDLHAADETALRLFHFLARQLRAAPVMLLATYRTDVPASAPFSTFLASLYREQLSERLALSPLSAVACGRLLEQILGGQPEPALAQTVFEATDGNPFFAQELVHALDKAGQIEMAEGRWRLRPEAEVRVPADLAGLLRERVKRQPSPVESVLVAAAALGREFSFDVLWHMADLPEAVLLTALDAALEARLIEESAGGYRFRHALIRLALYEAANRARRTWLHTRAAESIEAVFAQRPAGLMPHAEALAFHYELSDQRERAIPYLMQAGQKASGIYAFEVASRHFERALSLMDELRIDNAQWRWMILSALGWWSIILADTPRVVTCFEQALALPPANGWQPTRRERSSLHRGAAVALITAGDVDAAEAHLQAALAEIDEREDAAEYAHVLYTTAQFHWHRNEHHEAFDVAQHSLAIAERLNDPLAIARAFEMLALACHSLGEWQSGIHYEQQRTALAGPSLDVTEAFDVHL